MPGVEREARITKQWIDIGFQGQDPVTDLRGSGLLGLRQLHQFVMNNKIAVKRMFPLSCQDETFYFFSVTGLNITQKLVMSLQNIPATQTTE